jgi:hypothetical protein
VKIDKFCDISGYVFYEARQHRFYTDLGSILSSFLVILGSLGRILARKKMIENSIENLARSETQDDAGTRETGGAWPLLIYFT